MEASGEAACFISAPPIALACVAICVLVLETIWGLQLDFHAWTLKGCQYLDYAVEWPGLFITVGLLRERLLCLLRGF